jgi:hypothetical protein
MHNRRRGEISAAYVLKKLPGHRVVNRWDSPNDLLPVELPFAGSGIDFRKPASYNHQVWQHYWPPQRRRFFKKLLLITFFILIRWIKFVFVVRPICNRLVK